MVREQQHFALFDNDFVMCEHITGSVFAFLDFPAKWNQSFLLDANSESVFFHTYFKSLLPSASRKQNGRNTPSPCKARGGRKRFTSSDNSVARLTASNDPLAKSTKPAVGRAIRPTAPLPRPLKKPAVPSVRAPLIGCEITPVTPSTTP